MNAEECRQKGNESFSKGDFGAAIACYEEGMLRIRPVLMPVARDSSGIDHECEHRQPWGPMGVRPSHISCTQTFRYAFSRCFATKKHCIQLRER